MKKPENFDMGKSLDFLLKDILEQIKTIVSEQKDAPYTKLIELFFKGIDIRGKFSNSGGDNDSPPEIKFISGIDEESI